MAKNDELPPMGLPLVERSSSRYFLGVIAMILVCGGAVFAIGYGSIRLSAGPCDELYAEELDGLRAEFKFFRESSSELGLSKADILELRTGTQLAQESLQACCQQREDGAIDEGSFQECRDHAAILAAIPAELAATHDDPAAATKAIRTAAKRLRGLAGDLEEIASRTERDAAANVAAGPPSSD